MLVENLILELAKLIFINRKFPVGTGRIDVKWEDLKKTDQEERVESVKFFIENLTRLNMDIFPNDYCAPDGRKPIDKVRVEYFIKDFITKKVKRPSGIINIFPYQELALELCEEFSFDEKKEEKAKDEVPKV